MICVSLKDAEKYLENDRAMWIDTTEHDHEIKLELNKQLCEEKSLVDVLVGLLLKTEFVRCYMCENHMKNITLDGINNGCDGQCASFNLPTREDLLGKIKREMERTNKKDEKTNNSTSIWPRYNS